MRRNISGQQELFRNTFSTDHRRATGQRHRHDGHPSFATTTLKFRASRLRTFGRYHGGTYQLGLRAAIRRYLLVERDRVWETDTATLRSSDNPCMTIQRSRSTTKEKRHRNNRIQPQKQTVSDRPSKSVGLTCPKVLIPDAFPIFKNYIRNNNDLDRPF